MYDFFTTICTVKFAHVLHMAEHELSIPLNRRQTGLTNMRRCRFEVKSPLISTCVSIRTIFHIKMANQSPAHDVRVIARDIIIEETPPNEHTGVGSQETLNRHTVSFHE